MLGVVGVLGKPDRLRVRGWYACAWVGWGGGGGGHVELWERQRFGLGIEFSLAPCS